jgi:hypothetical protein
LSESSVEVLIMLLNIEGGGESGGDSMGEADLSGGWA